MLLFLRLGVAMQPRICGTCDSPASVSQVQQSQTRASDCGLLSMSADFVLLGHWSTNHFILNVLLSFKNLEAESYVAQISLKHLK